MNRVAPTPTPPAQTAPQLCPHGQNPKACLTCFHINRNKPKPKEEVVPLVSKQPGMVQGYVMPIGEVLLRSTQGVEARQRVASSVPQKMADGTAAKEPVQTASRVAPPEAFSNDKLWKPAKHDSLIDRQPKHPHKDEGTVKVIR
jgi:hypothetical protein